MHACISHAHRVAEIRSLVLTAELRLDCRGGVGVAAAETLPRPRPLRPAVLCCVLPLPYALLHTVTAVGGVQKGHDQVTAWDLE